MTGREAGWGGKKRERREDRLHGRNGQNVLDESTRVSTRPLRLH